MSRRTVPVLLAVFLTFVALPTVAAPSTVPPSAASSTNATASDGSPKLVAVYPNPVFEEDAGEFVVIRTPRGANLSNYALTDGETTVDLPAVDGETVLFSTAANRTAPLVDRQVRQLPGRLQLANGGESIRLVRGNQTVDEITYEDATEGEVLWLDGSVGGCPPRQEECWRPLGATNRSVVTGGAGTVDAFVLPDAGGTPAATLEGASERIYLAGYTLGSERVATTLRRAHRRNVTVRVLVEGGPVGGVGQRQAELLDDLAAAGVEVRVVGGERARYRYHHPKYAVVDDRAVVTTENWKPSGTGGRASRGWGVVTDQSRVVAGLAATFRADAGWRDAVPWNEYRESVNVSENVPATGTFGRRFDVETVPVNRTRLLVAPDNAEREVVALLRGAEESIWIEQASVGGVEQPFVRESVAAARRGVTVRLLLGSKWYNREDNQAIADRLNDVAEREGLDLEARLVDPDGRFDYLHAKGAVVDDEHVLLGSLNWNNHSARENREVALVLTGDEVAEYYGSVVRADWQGGRWRVSVGVALAVLGGCLVAAWRARRIGFAPVERGGGRRGRS